MGRHRGQGGLHDVEGDEGVEPGESSAQSSGLGEGRERTRARDEERADVARLDFVDEGNARMLIEDARELGSRAGARRDAALGRGGRPEEARLLVARQHARVEPHAALAIEGVGGDQERPAQPLAEQPIAAERHARRRDDVDATGAPDRGDEVLEIALGETGLAGDALERETGQGLGEGFAVVRVGEPRETILVRCCGRGRECFAHEPGEQDRVGSGPGRQMAVG